MQYRGFHSLERDLSGVNYRLVLAKGICHLPQRRLNPVWLQLLTINMPWKEFSMEKEALCAPEKWCNRSLSSVQFSRSVVSDNLWPYGLQHARLPCPSPIPGAYSNSCPLSRDAIQPSHPLSSPSPPAFNLSQGFFKWVSSSNQVAKVLEFQL